MAVNLSIKNVPDEIAEQLRGRARANHRSLQGELLAVLKASVSASQRLTPAELLEQVRASRLRTPRESAEMIRTERDGR